jgi:hypothetical protein
VVLQGLIETVELVAAHQYLVKLLLLVAVAAVLVATILRKVILAQALTAEAAAVVVIHQWAASQ